MSFLTGFVEGMKDLSAERERKEARQQEIDLRKKDRDEDRAFQREMFQSQVKESMRESTLKLLAEKQKADKELEGKLQAGVAIGLSKTTATALLRSGQLDLFLSRYEKNEKVDPSFVGALNTYVEEKMQDASPEDVSALMIAGVSTDKEVSDPQEAQLALMESILTATKPEQLDELYKKLLTTSSQPYTPLPRFDVDFTALSGLSQPETKALRRELAENLGTYFEDSFTVTDTGDVQVRVDAAPEVRNLFNEAERSARDMASGPRRQFSPTNAARFVSTQIESAVQGTSGMAKATDILQNFDTILADPSAFVTSYQVPVVKAPEPVTPEATVESLGDTDFGFGFDIDEEFRQRQ